jgi:nicotinamidase-related amidase
MPYGAPAGPHRHDLVMARERTALVLVDLQERLAKEVVRSDAVIANAAALVEAATVLGVPIVVTEHHARVFGSTVEAVRAKLPDAIPKIVFSCFSVDAFRERVNALGRKHLLVAGLETHICVCQTALDGAAAGFTVHAVRDACSSRRESDHAAGIEKMAMAGVVPCTTEIAIFELLERAGTDEFRKLLPLIKGR